MKIHGSPVRGRATSFTSALIVSSLFASLAAAQAGAPIPTPGQQPAQQPAVQPPVVEAPAAQATQPPARDAAKFLRFVRAKTGGAKVRNIYDEQGVAIAEVDAGGLFAVHNERAGWLDVEAPGGFAVWVYGEYLSATSEAGMLQVTGNDVRMRPLPSSGAESLPLRQLLQRGQKLRMIGRKDMSKPLAEDWVNVWSPVGTRGWVAIGQTEALGPDADGAALWAAAATSARGATLAAPSVNAPAGSSGAASIAANETATVTTALANADKALSAERAKQERGQPTDYDSVKKAYEAVLALGPAASTAELVKDRIELCTAYADGARLSVELESQKQSIDAALRRRQDEMQRAAKSQPFDGRGKLESVKVPGEERPVYLVRFSGTAVAEIVCTSGRYDLADFVGCELGFNGRDFRGPIASTNPALARPRAFDVSRLEVLTSAPTPR